MNILIEIIVLLVDLLTGANDKDKSEPLFPSDSPEPSHTSDNKDPTRDARTG